MHNDSPASEVRKSTLLLVLIILLLFNAALFFRAAVNTFFFADDPTRDYTEVTATVTELRAGKPLLKKGTETLLPVLTFAYRGQQVTRVAPGLRIRRRAAGSSLPEHLQVGDRLAVLVHDFSGDIILPPAMDRRSKGISQAVICVVFLVLAVALWLLRSWLWKRKVIRMGD